MRKIQLVLNLFVIVILGINLQACGSIQQIFRGTPTFTPTITMTPSPIPTATITLTPTETPSPTATPNLTATQQYDDFFSIVQKYYDDGVISSLNGKYMMMGDYADQSIDADTYRWELYDNKIGNFIVRANLVLETAHSPASQSGCGFVFGFIDSEFHEFVFLQRNGFAVYGLGGRVFTTNYYDQLPNPAEFTMIIIALDNEVRVAINDTEVIKIPLDISRDVKEAWGPSLLAGSTQDFGTRCTFMNVELWEVAP